MNVELYIYFFTWTSSVIYSIYCFSFATHTYFKPYNDEFNDFTEGIHFLPKRDKSDLEWESIMFLTKHYFPWVTLYLIVSHVIRNNVKSIKVLKILQILFTLVYIISKWNFLFLILVLLQPALFYIFNSFKFKLVFTWITSALSLMMLNYFKAIIEQPDVFEKFELKDYEMYILISSLFWINLKCTSFSLENINSDKTGVDILSYCLYPPTVFSGPFILYKEFENKYKTQLSMFKLKHLLMNVCRIMFWYSFCYICLHFVYVNAAAFHPQLVGKFDGWSLYGFGYTMGQFFHLKYVVLYGMSTSVASFENINVPNLPRCIGRVHLYSDMWKYFDPGLYTFLTRNIYLPLVSLTQSKLIRSLICFSFVYIWHGLESHILIWATLNYLGIIFENTLWPKQRDHNLKNIGQSWTRRMNCLIAALLLVISATSNFYFFAGTDVGHVFFKRLVTDFYGNILLIAVLYCCCQVSTELRTVPALKM